MSALPNHEPGKVIDLPLDDLGPYLVKFGLEAVSYSYGLKSHCMILVVKPIEKESEWINENCESQKQTGTESLRP